jgi:hypothetical protein
MNLLNKKYIIELNELKSKMVAAENFSKKFPYFERIILDRKITGEGSVFFGQEYKDMSLSWGINRYYRDTALNLTNYQNKHEEIGIHLTTIYVNTVSLYNSHEKFGLYDICNKCDVFYLDKINSTFYIADDMLIKFLDSLNEWYLLAKKKNKELMEINKILKLEKELARLKNE